MKDKQKLGLFSLIMIVISLVIGMGIFKTPATIAAKSGTATIFLAAWAIGGLMALCGALTYGEIGLRLPGMGGYYKIFSYCYHPSIGFTINLLIIISNAASVAVVALIGADYISDLLFGKPSGSFFNISVSILAVALFYGVNLLGLHASSKTQNILTVIKVGLVLLLISSLFKNINILPHGYDTDVKIYAYNGHNGLLLLILSLVAVSFTYGGYQQAINFGSEIRNPQSIQKSIIIGIIIVLILYLSISYAYINIIGFNNMKNATAIGAVLCEAWFGKLGGKIFDGAMFLSVLAYVNVLMMSNPRVMFAMSEDKVLHRAFSFKHHKTEVLITGLTFFAIATICIAFFGKSVDDILGFSMFLDCFGMITSASTLFILRKKKTGEEQVRGSSIKKIIPLLCIFYIIAYFFVLIAVIIDNPGAAITGIVLLLSFLLIYFMFYRKNIKK